MCNIYNRLEEGEERLESINEAIFTQEKGQYPKNWTPEARLLRINNSYH